jgi:hypothetical protein
MLRQSFLFMLLLPVIAACGAKSAKQDSLPAGQMRDVFPPQATAARTPPPAASSSPDAQPIDSTTWPVTVLNDGIAYQVHEPLVDAWDEESLLTAHALVVVRLPEQSQPVLGVVGLSASTQVDRAAGLATLRDLRVGDGNFPAAADRAQAWLAVLRGALPQRVGTVRLSRLESGLAVVRARQQAASTGAITPPRIIIATKPAVLVYIDGDPRYTPLGGTSLTGVLNTAVLLLKDASGRHYLHLYDGWVSATSLQGPWSIATAPPGAENVEQTARANDRVNLLRGQLDAGGRSPTLSAAQLPQIIVSTSPAALIVLTGAPRFSPIAGSGLQYATNTSAHLFRDESSKLYVRIGGYWFRASSDAGPWEYVSFASLPGAFSAIPDDSPKRNVKASISRSRQAAPATVSALTVVAADRKTARLSVTMNGDPVLQPIPGTELNYVANASVPVIQLDINNWYAIQNGVWFYSSEATGPWTVTDSVPPQIYAIPPSVPIYSAIHSRVFSSSTDVAYYGYPGAHSLVPEGGAAGLEDQGSDYQYTPPSGLSWGWTY